MDRQPPLDLYDLAARVKFLEEKIMDGIEQLKETQSLLRVDISKIKEATYHPDTGLYARLRVLEDSAKSRTKFYWLFLSIALGAAGTLLATQFT